MTDGALALGSSTTIDLGKYAELWSSREIARRTKGTEKRTVAMSTLWALSQAVLLPEDHEEHEDSKALSERLLRLRHEISAAWAAEDGWDTTQFVKGMAAANGPLYAAPSEREEKP